MFTRTNKSPMIVNQKQILYPVGNNYKARERAMAQAKKALEDGHMVFRYLSDEEELIFRGQARINYIPFQPIEGIWHPVYQDECVRINHELSYYRLRPRTGEEAKEDADLEHAAGWPPQDTG